MWVKQGDTFEIWWTGWECDHTGQIYVDKDDSGKIINWGLTMRDSKRTGVLGGKINQMVGKETGHGLDFIGKDNVMEFLNDKISQYEQAAHETKVVKHMIFCLDQVGM